MRSKSPQFGARQRQASGPRAGREHELVVSKRAPVSQMHRMHPRVDPRRRDAGDDVDAEIAQLPRVRDYRQFRRRLRDDR